MRRSFTSALFFALLTLSTARSASAQSLAHAQAPDLGTFSLGRIELPLQAIGGDGTNYTWQVLNGLGSVPDGLSIRTESARTWLSGVATKPGVFGFRLRVWSGNDFADQDYTLTVSRLVMTDPFQLRDAFAGEPYFYKLTAMRDGAEAPVTFAPAGRNYPHGMSLGPDGVLQGTPDVPGTYDFSYKVSDGADTVTFKGEITVQPIHIRFGSGNVVNGPQNAPFLQIITAAGGSNSYTFDAGGLPQGLTIDHASGAISGMLTASPGTYPVTATVTDTTTLKSARKMLAINVVGAPVPLPQVSPYFSSFQECTVGVPCNQGISVRAGGTAPFTWEEPVAGLPPGMSIRFGSETSSSWLTPGDAEMIGTPTVAGDYDITVSVHDANGLRTTNTFTLRVSALMLVDYLQNGTLGAAYSSTMRVIGGTPPYTVVQTDGRLPLGLALNPGLLVGGTPYESGRFNVQYRFTDSSGPPAKTLTVWNGFFIGGPLTITTNDDLGSITKGDHYSLQLSACCAESIVWSVVDGAGLPHGITLSPSGVLDGTPDVPGLYTFLVDAAAGESHAKRQFSVFVTSLRVTTNYWLPYGNSGSPYGGSPAGLQLGVVGGTPGYNWTLQPGGYLPPGMSLSSSGALKGVPTATGQFTFGIKVTDASNPAQTAYTWFSVTIYGAGALPPPSFGISHDLGTYSIGQVDGVQLYGTGGNGQYLFSPPGAGAPEGLSIRSDGPTWFPPNVMGLIGVATTPGTYFFPMSITSANQTTTEIFHMKITDLVVKDSYTLPDAFVGEHYEYQLTAERGAAAATGAHWALNGNNPPGVELSPAGVLSWNNPQAGGPYNVFFSVTDGDDTIYRSVNLTVYAIHITTSANVVPNATQNAFYKTQALIVTGGSGSYTYSVSGFTGNLILNPSTGELSGIIAAFTGPFSYQITATDTGNPASSYTKSFAVNVLGPTAVLPQVTAFNNVIGDCTVGVPCNRNFGVNSGGTAPFTWTAAGLPPGMAIRFDPRTMSSFLNPTQVELFGTPAVVDMYDITLTVKDALGVEASQTFPLHVSPLMTTNNLPNGTTGTPYPLTRYRVIGGTMGYTSSQIGGQFPKGLSYDGSALTTSGTPQEGGGFNLATTVVDTGNNWFTISNFFFVNGAGNGSVNISTGGILGVFLQGSNLHQQLFGCCPSSLKWSVAPGSLQPPVSLSSDGVLDGPLTTPGTYVFTVRAEQQGVPANYAQRQFTLVVTPIAISTLSGLPFGQVGTRYDQTLNASGGTGPYTWTLQPFNSLPPGLSLTTNAGVTTISGTPTLPGFFSFTLNIADSAVPANISNRTFSVSIYPAGVYPPLAWNPPAAIGPFPVGVVTSQLSGVSGGLPPYKYSYSTSPGTLQIPGMRVQNLADGPLPSSFPSFVTGGLIGVVTTPNVYQTSLTVTDSLGHSIDKPLTVTVSGLHILSQFNLPRARIGQQYDFGLEPYPAVGMYSWSLSNAPAWLSIDSGGHLRGTPPPGTGPTVGFNVTLRASQSDAVTVGYSLPVNAFDITNDGVLPAGTVGSASYGPVQLNASGCPCSWTVVQGQLPNGFNLNFSTGVLSSNGSLTGTFNNSFTIQARASNGSTAQKVFSLRINSAAPQPLTITNTSLGYTTVGNNAAFALFVQGGTGPYTWFADSGTLPPGVSIIQNSGELRGGQVAPGLAYLIGRPLAIGPVDSGTYRFTLHVKDSAVPPNQKDADFTWTVTSLNEQFTQLPVGFGFPSLVYQSPFTQALLGLGGILKPAPSTGYTWSSLVPLPTGLTLDPNTGVVSGTPINTGNSSITIEADDNAGNRVQTNVNFNIAGPTPTLLNFGTGSQLGARLILNNVQEGLATSIGLNPNGGTGPYRITPLTDLPPGCGLESGDALLSGAPANSYQLACVPTAAGTFVFTLEAKDSLNNVGAKTFQLSVLPVTILGAITLADASVNIRYIQKIVAQAGPNVVWSTQVPPGQVPSGFNVTPEGVIDFIPQPGTANSYGFNLVATDTSTGLSVVVGFSLRISDLSITNPQVLPVAVIGELFKSYQFNATGGGANRTWGSPDLPWFLGLDPNSGMLGMFDQPDPGTYTFNVRVFDGQSFVGKRFTLYVRLPNAAPLDYPLASTALPGATVGQRFFYTLTATGGQPPYAEWKLAPGSQLPPGIRLMSWDQFGTPPPSIVFGLIPLVPGSFVLIGTPLEARQYTFDLIVKDNAGVELQRTFTLNVTPINILPGSPRQVVTATQYSQQFTAAGGRGPYTFTLSPVSLDQDMLPPGLSLSSDGRIFGTTSSTGNYAFSLIVRDQDGHTFSRRYDLAVATPTGLMVTNTNPRDLSLGTGFTRDSNNLKTNGNSTYFWEPAPGNELPKGMQIVHGPPFAGQNDWAFAGQPTAAGTFTYTLRAKDTVTGDFADHTFTFRAAPMQMVQPPALFPTALPAVTAQVNTFNSVPIEMAGGTPTYHFTESPMYPLPPGMTLSDRGVLSGTPSATGAYTITPVVTDGLGYMLTTQFTFVVTAAGTPPPLMAVENTDLSFATAQRPYLSLPLEVFLRGGTPPFTWWVNDGTLPDGLKIVQGANGVSAYIAGIPSGEDFQEFSLAAQDDKGQIVTVPMSLTVSSMAMTPNSLAAGMVGTAMSVQLTATGGTPPYKYFVYPGADLPAGLSLDMNRGLLWGTPTSAGVFNVAVLVLDDSDNGLLRIYRVGIDNAAGEAPAVSLSPNAIHVNYREGAAGGATIPVAVDTTSGSQRFTLSVGGIDGSTVTPDHGIVTQDPAVILDVASLSANRYVGVLGLSAPESVNLADAVAIVLDVEGAGADTTMPVIPHIDNIIAEATSSEGAFVTFPTPGVTDDFSPAPRIEFVPPSGSLFRLGETQTVVVMATDASGNQSTGHFDVTVVDTTPPKLETPSGMTVERRTAVGTVVDLPVTANDIVDGPVVPVCDPTSGHEFRFGETTPVTCTATDSSGRMSPPGTFNVTVVDTLGPKITIVRPTPQDVYVVGQPAEASVLCDDPSGVRDCLWNRTIDVSSAGRKSYVATAFDRFGNRSESLPAEYLVIDPPSIHLVSPLKSFYAVNEEEHIHFTCAGAEPLDCGGDVTDGQRVDTSAPGFRSFTITAKDHYGNTATQTVTYAVGLQSCALVPDGITSFLAGDNGALDEANGAFGMWTGTPMYADGKVAQAFLFDGRNSLSLPQGPSEGFTLQAWVRTDNPQQPVSTGVLSTGAADDPAAFQIELDGAGYYWLKTGNPDLWPLFLGPATSDFQHIAVTFDPETTTLSAYFNGQFADSLTYSSDLVLPRIQALTLGADRTGTHLFAGLVDEVQVFNRALNDNEVARAYLAGSFGLCKDNAPVAMVHVDHDSPVEAEGPEGATLTFDSVGTGDPDPDDTPTLEWRENEQTISSEPTLTRTLNIGTHTITLVVKDGHFKSASVDVVVVVEDTTGPKVAGMPAPAPEEATGRLGAQVLWTEVPTADDTVDGPRLVTCTAKSGDTFPVGKTTVICSSKDTRDNVGTNSFDVTVTDHTPPAAIDPPSLTPEATSAGGAIVTWSLTADDLVDGTVPLVCSPESGSRFTLDQTTTVNCTATDAHDNRSREVSFNVTVVDQAPPVLDGVPSILLVEAESPNLTKATWTITAHDAVDPHPVVNCTPSSGSDFRLNEETFVQCYATDARNNRSPTSSFTVRVVDRTPPELQLPIVAPQEADSPTGAAVKFDVTATDAGTAHVAVQCTPSSGSPFPFGTSKATCTATDDAGLTSTGEVAIPVVDRTLPVADVISPSPDAVFPPGTTAVDVVVHTTDVVGVAGVTVNGVPAVRDASTTPQNGTWRATGVSITLPVAAGGALRFDVVATDGHSNAGPATRIVDNDGIASALDRDRATNADLAGAFSNDFNNGTTAGTIARGGWTVSAAPMPAPPPPPGQAAGWPSTGWVRIGVTGASLMPAVISACNGDALKQVVLSAAGQQLALACGTSGTIYVRALNAVAPIWVVKYPTATTGFRAQLLTTGQAIVFEQN